MNQPNILICDDDQKLCTLVCEYLKQNALNATFVNHGKAALDYLRDHRVDLIVLDLMMPVLDGLETLKRIRNQDSNIAVIMLTAKSESVDKILSLEIGADDYLVKPHHPRELLARIHSVLRRSHQTNQSNQYQREKLSVGDLNCNNQQLRCYHKKLDLQLTDSEFLIFRFLMGVYPNIADKQVIAEACLNRKLHAFDRSLDVHISNIRNKLKQQKIDHLYRIKTIRSQGYLLQTNIAS